jgi:hypothetical protein
MKRVCPQPSFDLCLKPHDEGQQSELRIDIGALFVAGFGTPCRNRCAKRVTNEFPGTREIGKRLLQRGLVGWRRTQQAGNFQTPFHDEAIVARGHDGNPICHRPAVFLSRVCDISAERIVTTKQQSAGSNCNEEAVSVASHLHAPKLCLGETHVPLDFLSGREKMLPVVVKIRYARY